MKRMRREKLSWAYEMFVGGIFEPDEISAMPFGAVYGSVPPGMTSKHHGHQDAEIYIALSGTADVHIDGQSNTMVPGDCLFIPPWKYHKIVNTSVEPFDLVALGWDDPRLAKESLQTVSTTPDGVELVVTPPPTPNGGLHLGHLSGPYLRADMYARGLQVTGNRVARLTGTDDFQSYVEVAASRAGTSPDQLVASTSDRIRKSFARWDIQADVVTEPSSDAESRAAVEELFQRLRANSAVVSSEEVGVVSCTDCGRELFQGLVEGTCRLCGVESCGDLCEACGFPDGVDGLVDARCRLCGGRACTRTERREVLDLQSFAGSIRAVVNVETASTDVAVLIERLTSQPLAGYQLCRESGWGTPAGTDAPGLVIDSWLDLCLTYLAAVSQLPTQPSRRTLFMGFDNSYYYAVVLVAVAFALGLESLLPSSFISNRFLTLDGRKFSTSQGHAVWADDERLPGISSDSMRIRLLALSPETSETDMRADAFLNSLGEPLEHQTERVKAVLIGIAEEFGARVPATGAWTRSQRALYETVLRFDGTCRDLLNPRAFSSRSYIQQLELMAKAIITCNTEDAQLRQASSLAEEVRTSGAVQLLAIKQFAAFMWPVAPDSAQWLWSALGQTGAPVADVELEFLPGGAQLSPQMTPATA